jgi:nucleotide-binding universal stress UspA family protein
MTQEPSILVGIDYSDQSKNALLAASRMANARNMPLVCFHVLDKEVLSQVKHMDEETEAGVLSFAEEKVATFIREIIGTGRDITIEVLLGNPFKLALDQIEKHHAETLVLGSGGYSSEDGHHVGALASRCIRKAPVEVLLVRNYQDHPFEDIVACVDFSENSNRAVHRAAALAAQDKARLKLIHVFRPPAYAETEMGWLGPAFPVTPEEDVQGALKERLEGFAERIASEYHLENITCEVITSHSIHRGIWEALKEMEADLVVLGTRGRTGFKSLLLGTTAEGLINHTPCSALTLKPEGFEYSLF